ncbi:MAG: VOC family protein, partial [Nanoarchaeota archaeon]
MNIENLISNYQAFFADLLTRLQEVSIDVEGLPLSHMNYRVATLAEYETLRDQLKPLCKEFAEPQFNGRAVSILDLKEPLVLPKGYS